MKRLLLLWLSIVAILAGCKKGNEPPTPEPAPAPIPLGTVELSEDVMVYTPPQNVADPVVSYDGKTLVLKVGSEARSLRMGTSATYTNYKSQQTGTPKKNDILVVPLNKGKEPHFLRLLSDPRFQNGEMTVITAAPQAKDVVYAINTDTTINLAPYLHLLSEKEGELSEKEWIYDQEYLQKTGKLFDIKKTDLLKVKTEREGDKVILKIEQGWDSSMFKESKNLNVKLKTLLTCEMSPKLRVRLRKYKKQNGFDIATGSLLGDVKIKLDAEAEAKLKSKATSEWISLVDKSLGWIPIGGGPLAVTPRCQIKFRWGISGELEFKLNVVTWEAPFDYEAGYDKNRQGSWFFSKDYKSGRFKWFDDYSMTAKGVLSPDLRVGVSFRFNNLQNLEGTLGIGFNANLEANGKFSKHSQELNGNIYYETKTYLFAGFEVDFAKWFNLGYDFVYNLATTEKEELILGEKKEEDGVLKNTVLSDDFNASELDLNKWEKTGYPNSVRVRDGVLEMEQNGVDLGVNLRSKYSFKANDLVKISRRAYIHHANSESYPWMALMFEGGEKFQERLVVYYADYDYENLHGTICIHKKTERLNGRSVRPFYVSENLGACIKDSWFKEEILLSFKEKKLVYKQNDTILKEISLPQLRNQKFYIQFNPYGWWTGHKHYMDDFKLEVK